MTISVWVNGWSNRSNIAAIVSKDGEGGVGWQIRQRNSNIGLDHPRDRERRLVSNSTTVSQGGWHMVTMTYDGSRKKHLH